MLKTVSAETLLAEVPVTEAPNESLSTLLVLGAITLTPALLLLTGSDEVLDKENAEEYLLKYYNIKNISTLKKSKAIELGHIFALGTKYSQSMDIKYVDCNNKEQPFYISIPVNELYFTRE